MNFHARRAARRARIRRIVFGDAPPPSVLERILLVLSIVALGFACFYFRLTTAAGFRDLGFIALILYFIARRLWWKLKKRAPSS